MANEKSAKALVNTAGFAGGKELINKHLTFWTLTAWHDITAMRNFRNGLIHLKAVQNLPLWCDEASYVHWEQDGDVLPVWQNVYDKMMLDGKITKVRHPSPQQLAKNYEPIKWFKLERRFKASKA